LTGSRYPNFLATNVVAGIGFIDETSSVLVRDVSLAFPSQKNKVKKFEIIKTSLDLQA
jgi:hypothetical protein